VFPHWVLELISHVHCAGHAFPSLTGCGEGSSNPARLKKKVWGARIFLSVSPIAGPVLVPLPGSL